MDQELSEKRNASCVSMHKQLFVAWNIIPCQNLQDGAQTRHPQALGPSHCQAGSSWPHVLQTMLPCACVERGKLVLDLLAVVLKSVMS